jgi:hypothetical protein
VVGFTAQSTVKTTLNKIDNEVGKEEAPTTEVFTMSYPPQFSAAAFNMAQWDMDTLKVCLFFFQTIQVSY